MENQTEIAAIAKPARRFQFRLRTLMIGVTLLCGVSGISVFARNYYRAEKRADAAERFWKASVGTYDATTEHDWRLDVVLARNWCLARTAVPFADRSAACRRYLKQIGDAREYITRHEATDQWRLLHPRQRYPPTEFDQISQHDATILWRQQQLTQLAEFQPEADAWLAAGTANGEPVPVTNDPSSE